MLKGLDVHYDREHDWLQISYSGEWNLKTVVQVAKELMPWLGQWDCKRFLNDSSRATLALSRLELSLLPGFLEVGGMDRSWKRAVVGAENFLDEMRYYEQVSQKQGYNVKVFTDLDAAKEWLGEAVKTTHH